MRLKILLLALLMLAGCTYTTEPMDTAPAVSPATETEPIETETETEAETTDLWAESAEFCVEDALNLLHSRRYLVTGEAVWEPIPRADQLRLTIPTDMGEIVLLYSSGGKLLSSEPERVMRVADKIELPDHSLPSETDGLTPATVYNITKYLFTTKDAYLGGLLIRITSADELDAVYACFDRTTYLFEESEYYEVPAYDAAWFETHDLYIAVLHTSGSYPDLERMVVTDGNALVLGYMHSELGTEDIVGRHVYVEVDKGDVITWSGSDHRYHTAETYAAQMGEQVIAECRRYALSVLGNFDLFALAEPEYRWTTLREVPEALRSDYFTEAIERHSLTEDSRVLRFDLATSGGERVLFFSEECSNLNLPE